MKNATRHTFSLYKRLIWLIRKHPYTPALIHFKKIFHFWTFQTSTLPKTVAKKLKIWHHFHALYALRYFTHMVLYNHICLKYLAEIFGSVKRKSKVFLQDMMWFRKSAAATLRQDCFSESCVSALHCVKRGELLLRTHKTLMCLGQPQPTQGIIIIHDHDHSHRKKHFH